jgi:hypothetical protein
VTMTKIPSVAAARPRTLCMPGASLAPSTPLAQRTWPGAAPAISIPTYLRTKSAFLSTSAYYNSIPATVVAATVPAVRTALRDHVGADKQAAPPRGVPR